MKVKTFSDLEIRISADDLTTLLYRAKQGDAMFHENIANQNKIVRLKKEYTELKSLHEKLRKEVIKMPVKWTRGKAQRPAPHDSDKPKAAKTTKADKKPNGKKEAK